MGIKSLAKVDLNFFSGSPDYTIDLEASGALLILVISIYLLKNDHKSVCIGFSKLFCIHDICVRLQLISSEYCVDLGAKKNNKR